MNEPLTKVAAARILLVDDQPANLDVLCKLLERKGHKISVAPSGQVALKIATQTGPDLILLDIMMPEMDGFEVCRRLKDDERTGGIPIIFITAKDLPEAVVQGFESGGVDYIVKPFQEKEVLARVQTHLQMNQLTRRLLETTEELVEKNQVLEQKNRELAAEITQRQRLKKQLSMISQREAQRWGLEEFVGQSSAVLKLFADVRLMQENPTTSVLITGESGTGKELIARAIHFGSERSEGPFVPLNCAAIPGELVESLLFGHVKGAFTGADTERTGYFEMAQGGTLFLDEIGDMPLELQAKLLRVLEDGRVQRVGEQQSRQVEVRVLAATNAALLQRIQEGGFRQDLYFRLARFTLEAAPLRRHPEDIPLLVQHFLRLFAEEMGREVPELKAEASQRLGAYTFPGNVRELKNIVERALIESRGGPIEPHHLHFVPQGGTALKPAGAPPSSAELPQTLDQAELWTVKRAVDQAGGNISEAARLLNTNRNRVYRVLAQEEEEH